ncbi:MAG: nucleotidyltransferase family protein [Acidobacteriota bacterium]
MPILVVMAAGAGSRYGGPKQLAPVGAHGERLFEYAIFDASRSGFGRVVFVVRAEHEREFEAIAATLASRAPVDVDVVVQRLDDLPGAFRSLQRVKPWGTGHALLSARAVLDAPFAIINADDFYGRDAYGLAAHACGTAAPEGATTVVAMRLADTLSAHGPVTRAICTMDATRVIALEEIDGIARAGASIAGTHQGRRRQLTGDELVSMNFWVCPPAILRALETEFELFLADHSRNREAEFRLPDVMSVLAARGVAELRAVRSGGPWFGLTHAEDLPAAAAGLQALAKQGVYPAPLWGEPC